MYRLKIPLLPYALTIMLAALLIGAGPAGTTRAQIASAAGTPAARWGAWSVVTRPNVNSSDNSLSRLAAISAKDVWAVGYFYDPSLKSNRTLIEHWNGTSWSVIKSPNVGAGNNSLAAPAALSAKDVWAVGASANINGPAQTLIEHWNGTSWSVVQSPNVGVGDNFLTGVGRPATSAQELWAVGYFYDPSLKSNQTLIEHWNGASWSVAESPNVNRNGLLNGVAAISTKDVWAVGASANINGATRTLIEHWNGTSWSVVQSPNVGARTSFLLSVGRPTISPEDVWAVGASANTNGPAQTLIEHWNGTSWSVVQSPNVGAGDNFLTGVAVISAKDVWAVGYYLNASRIAQTLIEHWNGTSWNIVQSPTINGNGHLKGVAAISTNDVWAVGDQNGRTLTEHWNGTSWSIVPSPNAGAASTP